MSDVRVVGPDKKPWLFGCRDIEAVDTKTGEVAFIWRERRVVSWRNWWQIKLFPLRCWWNTRQWRVLVTLPCGCQVLKNCKQPYVCMKCLRRIMHVPPKPEDE